MEADINNATCVSGSWNLDASAAFLFLPDTNAFYYVRRERERERRFLVRSRREQEKGATNHLKI